MRKIINKSTAIKAVVLIFALIAILLVFPIRVFTTVLETGGGGTVVGESDHIMTGNNNLMQEFVTQYDRLSSIDVYVTRVDNGRYISMVLIDERGEILFRTFVDTGELKLPCYVNIPVEVSVDVGKTYAIKVQDCRSKVFVGYEDIPPTCEYIGRLTRNYENIEGRHLAARYNYRIPLSKGKSLIIIGIIAAVCFLLCLATDMYYKKKPEKDSLMTVGTAVKYAANPVAAVVFLVLMIMVFPMKLFDMRVADIIFYELGLAITAAMVFYAINHQAVKREIGISFWQGIDSRERLRYVLMMFSMAMAIWYGSCYMNGLYDIFHTISERQMTFWLLIMMVLTFSFGEAFNLPNALWVLGSGIYGIFYYIRFRMPDTEKEYDLNNTILKYGILIVILLGLVVINFARLAVSFYRKRNHGHDKALKIRPTVFGVLMLVFLVVLMVLNNTRIWSFYLGIIYICLYLRFAAWNRRGDFYKILSGGFMMNFAISLIYSWLHRYFAGYVSGRFAFIFHTVTVTAEYCTFMGAVATVLLSVKVIMLPQNAKVKDILITAWKEIILFGYIMSYAVFTVSRTAYLAIIMSTLLVLVVIVAYNRKQFVRLVSVFVCSLVFCFPSAFTLQRILPTMVAQPVFYAIDDTDEFVRGGADWDNTNFMCVERFVNLFKDKMLGMEVGTYDYPIDRYNYDPVTGEPLYDDFGHPTGAGSSDNGSGTYGYNGSKKEYPLLAAAIPIKAEFMMLAEEMGDYVDLSNPLDVISNGRLTIFRSYIQQLNMWGHEEMGAELPNGEIAIHAHNTYLQVAYDRGVLVGILFIIVLVTALVSGIRYYRDNRNTQELSLITAAVVIGFMVAGISEWVFQYSNPMTIALMLSVAPITFKVQNNER
ncbi:MAG: hypothetical protein K6E91_13135 [Butyrivibrio sp.]|nr:hypothetical protein [Butyrivibrio sp.]